MKTCFTWLILIFIVVGTVHAQTGPSFDNYFMDKTLRLDYFHTGTYDQEVYSCDEIYEEHVWAGSKTNLLDTLNLGNYLFKVYDIKTNQLLFSRGFCSIFGEWQTTAEARKKVRRTFSESVRFPWPKRSVKLTIAIRDRDNLFHDRWDYVIDPTDPNIRKAAYFPDAKVTKLVSSGDSHDKVDLVILPDGYTSSEMGKFQRDARRLLSVLLDASPFKAHEKDFNVWTVEISSSQSGIDDPRMGKYVDNVLSCSFNAFGSDRYILTWDNKIVRKAASRVPYDFIYILINEKKYGGGGIFNVYATCTADNMWSNYVFVHEFGHSFAGLADEYYTSDVAYDNFYSAGVEPWEPNITAQTNKNFIKWQGMIAPDTPIPTPWDKDIYDSHAQEYQSQRKQMIDQKLPQAQIDSVTAAYARWEQDFFKSRTYDGKVGLFEGAGYSSRGLYRPSIHCQMFTRSMSGFDRVCQRAIENSIHFYTR